MKKARDAGTALLAVGGLYLFAIAASAVLSALGPEPDFESYRDLGASPEQIEEIERLYAEIGTPLSVAFATLGLLLSGLVVRAGLRMRALRSYGTCVAGAIAAALPCTTAICCCIPSVAGIPVGIWALVVLSQEDVRRAFEARAAPGEP